MSVLYLVNDDHGMLVGVERYEFDASSNPNPNRVHWPAESGEFQFQPIGFPTTNATGTTITNGCIRMSDDDIAVFAGLVHGADQTGGNRVLIVPTKEQE